MKKIFLLLLMAAPMVSVVAQRDDVYQQTTQLRQVECVVEEDENGDFIYDVVEENACFPGGDEELMRWLSQNIQYPSSCLEKRVQGRVIVSFIVKPNGSVGNVKVVRSPDENLSKEAVRLVKSMPKWKPARIGKKTVSAVFNLPIMFRIIKETGTYRE